MSETPSPITADAAGTPADAYASESARLEAINRALGEHRLARSPLARCIAPLMIALDWFGAPRGLLDSLPDAAQPIGLDDLGAMLAAQGFRTRRYRWPEWQRQRTGLDVLPIGSLLVDHPRHPTAARVYLGRLDGADWWHDGARVASGAAPEARETVLHIERAADHQPIDAPQPKWLGRLLLRARGELSGLLLISLATNLLALVISLFTMLVYNTIIPSGQTTGLWAMTGGVLVAIIAAGALRMARLRLTAQLTAWGGSRIADATVRKTLGLPFEVSGRLGVENNLTRLRTIEGVRQWFGGAGGAVNLDYPFVLIFLFVIALLGGWLFLVPLVGLLLFALVAWPLAGYVEARANRVGNVSRKLNEMTSVIIQRLRALRGLRGSTLWRKHLVELVAQSVEANRDHALAIALAQTIGYALGMLTVLATMGVGIALVLGGVMTTGGLIATMMLIWRVTTPAQQLFASQVRLRQLGNASRQLDRLLMSVGEASNPQITSPVAQLQPALEVDRVFYRYSADREPALGGVSFQVEPGHVVAIVGPNGAGKSTLLEILVGLRQPQNGRVFVGGRDIRGLDPVDYRAWVGYVPQLIRGLPMTISEAFRLRAPTASDDEMKAALERVAGPRWWAMIGADSPDIALQHHAIFTGLETREAVRGRFIDRLAAATLNDPPLVLLDDPLGDRDPALDGKLIELIQSLRGRSTVLIATHRADLIQIADDILVLDAGQVVHFGPVSPT